MTTSVRPLRVKRSQQARRRAAPPPSRWRDKYELMRGGAEVRAVGYARQSKDTNGKSAEIPNQHKRNRAVMAQYGWREVATYEDNVGASPMTGKPRDGYAEMCAQIDAGKFDVIVFYNITRQGRDLAVYVEIRNRCMRAGVYFWWVKGQMYDLRDSNDALRLAIDASISEQQSHQISDNVRRTMSESADRGVPHGPIPYGFRREYDKHNGAFAAQLADDELRTTATGFTYTPAGVVRWVAGQLLAGRRLSHIADELNRNAVPTPRQLAAMESASPSRPERWESARWHPTTTRSIVINPAIIGVRTNFERLVRGDCWHKLISEEDFYAVQDRLAHRPRAARADRATLLSALARCECGCKMYYRSDTAVYGCSGRGGCTRVPASDADAFVNLALLGWCTRSGRVAELAALDSERSDAFRAAERELRDRSAELDEWRRSLESLDAPISPAAFATRERALLNRIAELEEITRPRSLPPALRKLDGADAEKARDLWDGFSVDARRELVELFATVTVKRVGRGRSRVSIDQRVEVTFARP